MQRIVASVCAGWLAGSAGAAVAAPPFAPGELVRLTRSETLLFKGENFLGAPKGQEFMVLKHGAGQPAVYVAFIEEDGGTIALTLPADALESSPASGWADLLRGVEAFRDQRSEEARRLLARAGQDAQYRAVATMLAARINTAPAAAAQGLREAAAQLAKPGYFSLAQPIEEAADRLGAPPSKLDRADLARRAATARRTLWRARQAIAVRRLIEASHYLEEGLKAEPAHPELQALAARVQKTLADAEDDYEAAERMRRFDKGAVHALSALEDGLKRCADHPKLRALKKEMHSAVEERTAPPVTPAFLAAAKAGTSVEILTDGHRLYTTRCTECHELELLDSRSADGWQKAVASMAGRAHLNDRQQARILDYLAAAVRGMEEPK
jgi:hypothetical protein